MLKLKMYTLLLSHYLNPASAYFKKKLKNNPNKAVIVSEY